MALIYKEYPDKSRIELTVSGKVTKEDYDAVIEPIQEFIDTHGTIQMVEIIQSFSGFDPAVLLPGIKFDVKNIQHVSHVALVTDIGWMSPLARATAAVIPSKLRVFWLAEREAAHAWLDEEMEIAATPL